LPITSLIARVPRIFKGAGRRDRGFKKIEKNDAVFEKTAGRRKTISEHPAGKIGFR